MLARDWEITASDRRYFVGVHPDLVRVVERAAATSGCPRFKVIEGVRTPERQRQLIAQGVSWTMNSRHIPAENGYGHALDIVPLDPAGRISWAWPHYYPLADAIKAAARACGVPIEWGGDWHNKKDGPHWQLPWKQYPGSARAVAAFEPATDESETQAFLRSRTMFGGTVSTGGGVGIATDNAMQLYEAMQRAEGAFSLGNLFGLAIGLTIIAGSAFVIYARWCDAGRPLPEFLARRFNRVPAPAAETVAIAGERAAAESRPRKRKRKARR